MAFINSVEEDEDNASGMNQTQDTQSQSGQPVQTSSQSATMAPSATPKAAPTAKPAGSGSAPGFQNYTKANAGKAQDSLNSAVAQNVQNVGQKATNSINQATTAFGQKVDAGSLANRQNALQDVQNTVNSARNISAGTNVDQTQQDRFKEVINAQYKGPESLRQSGLYNQAAGNVDTAQTALNNTKTTTGREELLRNMYQKRGDYTAGLNKLDSALLNSSKQGVQNLQNVAAQQGNIAQNLDKAQISSANLAQNRTNEINQIKQQSRDAFTTGKAAEEAATEARLKSVTDNWEALPDYFKNIINEKTSKGIQLSPEEAAILGVQSGEGLYNLGAGAIKTKAAEKERLISKDEQARQVALSQLAGLDMSNLLSKNVMYSDAEKAGTMTAADALDVEQTRKMLNEAETGFRESVDRTITGTGSKKNKSSGKRYNASESANLKDLLSRAGYDFDAPIGNESSNSRDVLNAVANGTSRYVSGDPSGLAGAMDATVGRYANMGDGESLPQTGADLFLNSTIPGANLLTGALGLGSIGTIAGNIFGGGTSSKASKNKAQELARKDLNRNITGALNTAGFENRFDVQDNEQTKGRLAALQTLLANMDKTNS